MGIQNERRGVHRKPRFERRSGYGSERPPREPSPIGPAAWAALVEPPPLGTSELPGDRADVPEAWRTVQRGGGRCPALPDCFYGCAGEKFYAKRAPLRNPCASRRQLLRNHVRCVFGGTAFGTPAS